MRQICFKIFHDREAYKIETEADNCIVIFPSTIQAVMAAKEMQLAIIEYNGSLSEDMKHY